MADWLKEKSKRSTTIAVGGRTLEFTPDAVIVGGCGGGKESAEADENQPEGRRLSGQQALVNLTAVFLGWCKQRGVYPAGQGADDIASLETLSTAGSRRCHLVSISDDAFCIKWAGAAFSCTDGENVVSEYGASDTLQSWADRGKCILAVNADFGVVPMKAGE